MKLVYIVTGRFPTERAYGIQIQQTVLAMREQGVEVTIKVPNPALQNLLYLGKMGYWLRTLMFCKWLFLSGQISDFGAIYTRDPFAALLLSFVSKNIFLELHNISSLWLLQRAVLRIRGVIVISKGLADTLRELGLGGDRIFIAPDAVDYNKFAINLDQTTARREFDLPKDKKIVLYAGLFDEWKGYKILLEASRSFVSDILLVMAGGRPEQVNELTREFANVRFLGWTDYDKLPILQRAADVLILPNSAKQDISRLYTSPLKLFAYMASGVPIIASDLPSIREVVDEGMVTFVPPDDPKVLTDVISGVLRNPSSAESLASRARQRVQNYTWQNRARVILHFINKCGQQS